MAGRKVFTSGEILTAADVNSFLMDQSVMVFADSTARGSAIPSPSEGMATYLQDVNQLQVYDGSQFGPVGSVLQVVSTTKTDTFSTTSTSFTDVTGLTASITPSSTANKIMVIVSLGALDSDLTRHFLIRFDRNGTLVGVGDASSNRSRTGIFMIMSGANRPQFGAVSFLDSPNSTSALTYKAEAATSGGTIYVNRSQIDSDTAIYGRTASTITLMEIAG